MSTYSTIMSCGSKWFRFSCIFCIFMPVNCEVNLYVGPMGSDHNSGLNVKVPFKTIHSAVSYVESNPQFAGQDVVITLLPGYYDLESTLNIRGTSNGNITIKAYKNWEIHVTGGKRIPSMMFQPVFDEGILRRLPMEARNKVMAVNLTEAGITDLGKVTYFGGYKHRRAPLEVFFNGEPLRLAQWPNEGFVNIMNTPDGADGARFTYEGNRPVRWTAENDLWGYGYWYRGWSDEAIKIIDIDTTTKTMTLQKNSLYGMKAGVYDPVNNSKLDYTTQGGYYRVINVLAELDQPGEYYVDRTSGMLYIWLPTSNRQIQECDRVYVSLLDNCLQLEDNSRNIRLEGFSIEACRHYGVMAKKANNFVVKSMEIKNTGSYNLVCLECKNTLITRSYFHDGDGGIRITGGNRVRLTSSGNIVSDNRIWRFSRVAAVGYDAIKIEGVGGHVHHNHISVGQYTGIWWSGNDHLMEYNHVHHVCMNTSDCGAFHSGRDWTWRGNVIQKNYIHHTLRYFPGAHVRGVMLDDRYSSVLIQNNVFFDNEIHVNIGGGRDNIVKENIFYNGTEHSVHADSRGLSGKHDATLISRLNTVPYKSPLWSTRYPRLAALTLIDAKYPRGNKILKNIYLDADHEVLSGSRSTITNQYWFLVEDNIQASDPSDFNDPRTYDFRPSCTLMNSYRFLSPTTPIPISEVGPRYQIGPLHLNKFPERFGADSLLPVSDVCVPETPSNKTPRSPYLTDGSVSVWSNSTASAALDIPLKGCLFKFEKCPDNVRLVYDGTNTEFYQDARVLSNRDEATCLARVRDFVTYCGQNSAFIVVYSPTGAMTLGGEGCFFADYGCARHRNLKIRQKGHFYRDDWAERNIDAAVDEAACLGRAASQYRYCGNDESLPVTSIYRPTGRFRTAGGGCWIKVPNCPERPDIQHFFYDSWGARNAKTDADKNACFNRAEYYWRICGADPNNRVTAIFRPDASESIYP